MKLDVKALALTSGLFWGFGLFCLTWWMIASNGATGEETIIGKVYIGYNISAAGSFIGLAWAFFDGLIGGAVFAGLYNWIVSPSKSAEA